MPNSFEEVAEQLNDALTKSGRDIVTIDWPAAYEMTNTARWTTARTEAIKDVAWEEHGILVTSGNAGLFVIRDENFSPIR